MECQDLFLHDIYSAFVLHYTILLIPVGGKKPTSTAIRKKNTSEKYKNYSVRVGSNSV